MSKKHFILLAQYIKQQTSGDHYFTQTQLDCLADFCHSVNPAFNRERWLDYIADKCGPNGGAR
jgi:hypothetical protein